MNYKRMMDTSLNELCKEQENQRKSSFRPRANPTYYQGGKSKTLYGWTND